MYLDRLIEQLNHSEARTRLLAIYVLDMVDEVRGLNAISARVPIEMDTKVEQILKEVGRRLNKLKREGYDTVRAICEHYNVYREVLAQAEEGELKKLQNIATFSNEERKDTVGNKIVLTTSQLIAVQALGIGAALGGTAVSISSNMGSLTETLKKYSKRVMPTTPSNRDFSQWLKRLKSDNPEERQEMLVQLNSNNNPDALPYMAHMYKTDPVQTVRDTAKRLGRVLYWNTSYYELIQDGTVDKITHEFAESLGISLKEDSPAQKVASSPASQESIADILAKAEVQRKKRGR